MLKHNIKKLIEDEGLLYSNTYFRYENMMLNAFEWEGLPSNLEGRHVERALYEYGNAILFDLNGEDLGLNNVQVENKFLILGATCGGDFNVLGEPTSFVGNGYGQTFNRTLDNCVLCRNTPNSQPSITYVRQFAREMTEVKKTITTNIIQQKYPFIIPTTPENELTMKSLFSKIDNGEYAFFVDKNVDLSGLKVLDTKVPYIAGQLNEYRFELEREILTFIGLNNHFEKSERLIVDEVNSNNDYVNSYIDLMYNERVAFCKRANKKYNLNISVKKRYGTYNNFQIKEDNINVD